MTEEHYTATSTTTTTTRTTVVTCNINYITSPPGILKMVELFLGVIAWGCAASYNAPSDARSFVLVVTIPIWLLTLITFVIYLTGAHATSCTGFPWAIFEVIFNGIVTVLYFIAACVIASIAGSIEIYGAAAAFAFFTTIAYLIHAILSFRSWRGVFPWQACSASGNTVQA